MLKGLRPAKVCRENSSSLHHENVYPTIHSGQIQQNSLTRKCIETKQRTCFLTVYHGWGLKEQHFLSALLKKLDEPRNDIAEEATPFSLRQSHAFVKERIDGFEVREAELRVRHRSLDRGDERVEHRAERLGRESEPFHLRERLIPRNVHAAFCLRERVCK